MYHIIVGCCPAGGTGVLMAMPSPVTRNSRFVRLFRKFPHAAITSFSLAGNDPPVGNPAFDEFDRVVTRSWCHGTRLNPCVENRLGYDSVRGPIGNRGGAFAFWTQVGPGEDVPGVYKPPRRSSFRHHRALCLYLRFVHSIIPSFHQSVVNPFGLQPANSFSRLILFSSFFLQTFALRTVAPQHAFQPHLARHSGELCCRSPTDFLLERSFHRH